MIMVPLASSSKGNAYILEHEGSALLIDDGLSYRELQARWRERGEGDFPVPDGVLITHSHTDHVSGLKSFLKKHPDVPVFANSMTAETVVAQTDVDEEAFACFENGQTFEVGIFSVSAFSIPHDTSDPVGFIIRVPAPTSPTSHTPHTSHTPPTSPTSLTYFHATDVGVPLDSIGLKLAEADIATLESNHDPVMLRTSGRAPNLIQRIAGPRGHLSNDEAAELVRRFASPRLRALYLAHLSRDCNTPDFAETTMRAALADRGLSGVSLHVCD